MSERLRPRDLAFLAAESPSTPMHNATVEIFDPGDSGFDYDRLRRADRGPDLVRAALPPADPGRAGPARQPGLGRRRALRPRLPRTPLRAAAPGQPRPAPRAGRPGSSPGRSTAAARCGRSTSSRGSPTAGSRCSPSPTRCWSTASTPSTSARCCSTSAPEPEGARRRRVAARRRGPSPSSLVAGAVRDSRRRRRHRRRHGPQPRPARVLRGAAAAPPGVRPGRRRAHRPRPRAGVADQRPALPAAPVRHRAHRPRRLPHGARGARRHRQRRHPGDRHRRAARPG